MPSFHLQKLQENVCYRQSIDDTGHIFDHYNTVVWAHLTFNIFNSKPPTSSQYDFSLTTPIYCTITGLSCAFNHIYKHRLPGERVRKGFQMASRRHVGRYLYLYTHHLCILNKIYIYTYCINSTPAKSIRKKHCNGCVCVSVTIFFTSHS